MTLPFASKASRINLLGQTINKLKEMGSVRLALDYLKALKDEMKGFETEDEDDPIDKLTEAITKSIKKLEE